MRSIIALSMAALLASCTAQPSVTTSPTLSARLPTLGGQSDLLSTSDVNAIVAEVKRRFGPSTRVYRVNIESANHAQAFYGNPDSYDRLASTHAAEVERRGSDWRLTGTDIVTLRYGPAQ
jgi:hypothetical protein